MPDRDDETPAAEQHVTAEHYAAVRRGELSPGFLALRLHRHALAVDPELAAVWLKLAGDRVAFDATLRDLEVAESEPPPAAEESVATVTALSAEARAFEAETQRLQRFRWRIGEELGALLRADRGERRRLIAAARSRFGSRMLVELLIDEARDTVRHRPAEARDLAELAGVVLARVSAANEEDGGDGDDASWRHALEARAAAHRANADRVAGDLPAASRAFAALRRRLVDRPTDDPGALAEVASLEASLRIDERGFGEAERLLDRAALLYERAGDREGCARTLLNTGNLSQTLGRPEEALARFEAAAARLGDETIPYLRMILVTNRANALCDLGRHAEAGSLLETNEDTYEASDDLHVGATLRGLHGRIALGLGRHDEAAEYFSASRDAFLALDRAYDAALASLDLALVYLEAGRTAELKKLSARLVQQFRTRGVGREALAALSLFAKAVAAEKVTAKLIVEVKRRFEATP